MLEQISRKQNGRKQARVLRTHAKRGRPRYDLGIRVQQINSPLIGSEQPDDLAKGAIQHFIQSQRLIECLPDRVQDQKFAVPTAYFLLRLFALGDIEHESLV